MSEERKEPEKPKTGNVITIGSGGRSVGDLSIMPELRKIADETGETIVVTQIPEPGEEDDGKPIRVNPPPERSEN
jgi:hypothetical protein